MRLNKIGQRMEEFPGGTLGRLAQKGDSLENIATNRDGQHLRGFRGFFPHVQNPEIRMARLLENVSPRWPYGFSYQDRMDDFRKRLPYWYKRKASVMELVGGRGAGNAGGWFQEADLDREANIVELTNLSPSHSYSRGMIVPFAKFQNSHYVIIPNEPEVIAFVATYPVEEFARTWCPDNKNYRKQLYPVWSAMRLEWVGTKKEDGDPPFWNPNTNASKCQYVGYRMDAGRRWPEGGTEETWGYRDASSRSITVVDHMLMFQDRLGNGKMGFAVARQVFGGKNNDGNPRWQDPEAGCVYEIVQMQEADAVQQD